MTNSNSETYDIIVIGGGATGLGIALESASRGYRTLVVEAYDYGKGTSSKSTKLVHGGIRYLANLDFALVKEGLEERYYFINNAPHLAKAQTYLIPFQNVKEKIKYWLGIKIYDSLAGKLKLGKSRFLSKEETLREAPDLASEKIIGGAVYLDGQFDDTRLLITLVKTFETLGGTALNYTKVTDFTYADNKQINGIIAKNQLNEETKTYSAKHIINATGTFSDSIMNLAEKNTEHKNVAAAQGTHLVFDKEIFNSDHAILIPETGDGRVLFILPWHDKALVGTTDIKVSEPTLDPQAQENEIDFILEVLSEYCNKPVSRHDIKSVFSGQRPLVKSTKDKNTAKISRKHEIFETSNGLVTMAGGKWTIYRRMGQDTIDYLEKTRELHKTQSRTHHLKLFGYTTEKIPYPLGIYGTARDEVVKIQQELNNFQLLHNELPYFQAEVIYHVRHEHARTIEDILARRTRALFLNSKAALASAATVASLMANELGYDHLWQQQQLKQLMIEGAKYSIGNNSAS